MLFLSPRRPFICVPRAACTELTDRWANKLFAEGKIKTTLADADFDARMADLFKDCPDCAPS